MRSAGCPGRIDADAEEHLEEIRRFLRRPTVSASDDDMLVGAEHVAAGDLSDQPAANKLIG